MALSHTARTGLHAALGYGRFVVRAVATAIASADAHVKCVFSESAYVKFIDFLVDSGPNGSCCPPCPVFPRISDSDPVQYTDVTVSVTTRVLLPDTTRPMLWVCLVDMYQCVYSPTVRCTYSTGVADGVGGWRTYGVDPSRFSRRLMQVCAQMVREGRFEPHAPANLIAASYGRLREMHDAQQRKSASSADPAERRASSLAGSCTACVVVLDRLTSRLHTANLGDFCVYMRKTGSLPKFLEFFVS